MTNEFGILYAATGRDWIEEAAHSAQSAKKQMPDVPIALFCDDPEVVRPDVFDTVVRMEAPTRSSADKIHAMIATPFEKTLFLDTDTLVIEPVTELGPMLDRFEFAYCHAPFRYFRFDKPGVNAAFPMGNSGVIAFRRTESVMRMLQSWERKYRLEGAALQLAPDSRKMMDQRAFRAAVWESDLNFTILPPEYNLRALYPYFAGGRCRVKILHGREPTISRALMMVNRRAGRPRVGNANRYGWEVIRDALGTIAREIGWHLVRPKNHGLPDETANGEDRPDSSQT